MQLSKTLLLAALFFVVASLGCATEGGYSGGYTSATIVSGPPVYGYPGWPGYYAYGPPSPYRGVGRHPGAYFGGPRRYPRFSHPGYRPIPPQFRSGPRWGGPRHFRG